MLEDRLHARTPLLPQAPCDPHHRVGRAVAVGEHARIEQVDAHRTRIVRQVDQPHPPRDLGRHVL